MSVYQGRAAGRFDDSRSVVSDRTQGGTRVTRYIVKEDDRRSRYDEGAKSRYDDARSRYDDRRTDYGDNRVEETKIIRTTRDDDDYRSAYGRVDPGFSKSRETITIRRDESPERRDRYWEQPLNQPVEDRELVIRRTVERDTADRAMSRVDDRQSVAVARVDNRREARYSSDYELVSPQRPTFDDREREVQRYIRTTDYYQPQPPQQPQTIIIRESQPIIIRERGHRSRSSSSSRSRHQDFQIVKKSDAGSVSRRSRSAQGRDEEYFYEKKVRERLPDKDRRGREVSPGDSISQAGRRGRERGYESDDSMVYVRKEVRETSSAGSSPDRARDLAAGAAAGIGAAELLRRHNNKEGKEVSHGGGRVVRDVGAGLFGAAAAEGIRRYRSKSRKRGSRSRSDSRSRPTRRRDGSRSRSNSGPNLKTWGGLALAGAAVAAGALLANKNKDKGSQDRKGRSHSRRGSRSRSRDASRTSLVNDRSASNERNPEVRTKRTAAAGAVGAAAMALYERHRSKSRGRASSESPNRIKQGAPIVGAGLGAAALAHLYENRKAKNEADNILKDEHRRSRSRRRSTSRAPTSASTYYDGPAPHAYSDTNLVQYGTAPINGSNFGEGYYGQARPMEQDYYNNSAREIVPVPVPPPAASSYEATDGRRSRRRTGSSSDSRSRSRSRGAAAAAAAAGAGIAASQIHHMQKEKKERKRRSRDRHRSRQNSVSDQHSRQGSYAPYTPGRDPYEDANWQATHSASYSQGMNDPYANQTGFYPQAPQFPPPPGSMPHQQYAPQPTPGPGTYGPQDFPPPPAGAPQAPQAYNDPYVAGQNPYAPRYRGADENVSAASFPGPSPSNQHHSTTHGVNDPREMAISPPIIGSNVTVQRPSTSISAPEKPATLFPGNVTSPFQQPLVHDVVTNTSSGNTSPGGRAGPIPGSPAPIRPDSRAAKTYTPPPSHIVRPDRDRSSSAQIGSPLRDTPLNPVGSIPNHYQQRPQGIEDPRMTRFTDATYAVPRSNQGQEPESDQSRPPEMQQRNRGNLPFMPSPDIRPPSDENFIPPRPFRQMPTYQRDVESPMPDLFVPGGSSRSNAAQRQPPSQPLPASFKLSYIPPAEERQARDRSRSMSRPGTEKGDITPKGASSRAQSVEPSAKKSVSFNPKQEVKEFDSSAETHKGRAVSDSDGETSEKTSRRRDRDRDRERGRDHAGSGRPPSKERRGYDAGDDYSDDTPFEDTRRRSHDRGDRERQSSRRERSNTQPLENESGSTRDRDRDRDRDRRDRDSKRADNQAGSLRRKDRDHSPGSDGTIDLPERFDDKGRSKSGNNDSGSRSQDQDALAQGLDQILGGLFGGSKKR